MTTYQLYDGTPSVGSAEDPDAVDLGTEFYVTATGWVTQIRFMQPSSGTTNTAARTCAIYSTTNGTTGAQVAGPFTMPTPTSGQWCTYTLVTPFQLVANTRYRVVILHPSGQYAATNAYFTTGGGSTDRVTGIVTRPSAANALANRQGSYLYSGSMGFPFNTFEGGAYYSDVTISDVDPNGVTGTLSATVPKVTSSSTGTITVTGTMGTALPLTRFSATSEAITGTLTAAVPKVTAAATATVVVAGSLASPLTMASFSASGELVVSSTLSTAVPVLTADLSGEIGALPVLTFIPPVEKVYSGSAHPLLRRVPSYVGITVLKEDGIYRQVSGPVAPEEIDAAEAVYLGGHQYAITEVEQADLVAAGYEIYISLVPGG